MQQRPWHARYHADVPPSLDYEPLTLPAVLERSARRFPDRTALVFSNCRLSWSELHDEVLRCAGGLASLGVGADEAVAIQLPNLPQTVIAYFAVLQLGGRVVMTNPLYTPRELEHQWHDAGCRVAIVADFVFDQKLREARDQLPIEQYVVASIPEYLRFPLNHLAPLMLKKRHPPSYAKFEPGPGLRGFRELVRGSEPHAAAPPDDWERTAVLQYTGGTTGRSKGAELTHKNLVSNVQQIDAWFVGVDHGAEVLLAVLPLFHVFGMTCSMNWGVWGGSTIVLMPDPRDVGQMVKNIRKHRVSVLPAVPAMFNAINHFKGVEDFDLSSVKACFSGSAPLPRDVQDRFEALTGCTILEGFGLTESSPVTHCAPMGGERRVGTIGVPISDTDARVVDVDGGTSEMPPGREGELCIRGPQVMRGYWNNPEETAIALRDGWLYTGDLATMDEQGYFRIVGRKKDMILCGGYNVYPDEIDGVLVAHADVLEAATIGVPHERRGETVKSFVVLRPGGRATPQELEAHCRERLAAYKVPREIELIDELPKSTVLKVLRRELRERELAKRRGA